MDIHRILKDLNEERRRLERIIESLEVVVKTGGGYIKPPSRRGRKFMDAEDRLEVSERMKRYWAGKREEKKAKAAAATASGGASSVKPAQLSDAGFSDDVLTLVAYAN